MKKTKLTRSLLAACSIVALTAVMYGCVHDGSEPPAMEGPPAPASSSGQERFDARSAVRDAQQAKDAATTATGTAVTNATTYMDEASGHAGDASDAADRAMAARTDYENAKMASDEADKKSTAASTAKTAADKAKTALDDAVKAYMTAVDGQDIDTKAGAAAIKAAAEALETAANKAKGDAEQAAMDAMGARDDAMTYAGKAEMYEGTHVVGLLRMANAAHITTAADPDANPDETEAGLIEQNRLQHVAMVNTAASTANADDTDPRHGGGTVTATYPYYASLGADNAFGGTGVNADTGPGQGLPAISVNPEGGGDAVALVHAGPGPDGDAGTDDDIMANFVQGPGLGDFVHENYIGRNNDTDNDGVFDAGETRQRIILFTDIEQANAPADEVTASVVNVSVSASQIDTLGTANGLNYEDGEYDHDGDPNTATLTGDFTCTDPATCSITVQSGEVQSISGYTFSSDANEVIVAAVPSEEDDTYLAFGVWLQETAVDGVNTYAFGAFADGGAAIGDTGEPTAVASVTGDATYTGNAAGVHSTATEVEFFYGDVELNAKFGDGTAIGTIAGKIHNIVAGGVEGVTDDIELRVVDPGAADPADNIVDAGTFSGRARMGNTGMQDSSGEDIYRYTGGWSGSFYNHMADNADTADVDESTRAPGSVAGTFGVGMADDAMTMDVDESESYVGAFGAHCAGTNCNPN